jgi:hypothetical protein
MSRADQIREAFLTFHRANPEVWRLFEHFTLEAASRGHQHYSASAVCERIRWHTDVETVGGEGVKINNNFRAYYARMFHRRHPELPGFFRNRVRISTRQPEHTVDRQVHIDEAEYENN